MLQKMNLGSKIITIGATVGLSACSPQSDLGVNAAQFGRNTPASVIASAARQLGQIVTVEGYFTWRTDTRALWQNRDAYVEASMQRRGDDYDYWAQCLTVYPAADSHQFSDRRVRVTGRVVAIADDDVRRLWACNTVAIEDATIVPM